MVNDLSIKLISGILIILIVIGHGLKIMLSKVAEQTETVEKTKAAEAKPTEAEAEKTEKAKAADACDGTIPGQSPAGRTRQVEVKATEEVEVDQERLYREWMALRKS